MDLLSYKNAIILYLFLTYSSNIFIRMGRLVLY